MLFGGSLGVRQAKGGWVADTTPSLTQQVIQKPLQADDCWRVACCQLQPYAIPAPNPRVAPPAGWG